MQINLCNLKLGYYLVSWKDTYLIHKLKASPLEFHFSLHLRSLLMSISIRFTFMLSIHSFLSSCCQVLGCGMRKGRVSSPSLSLRKRRQRPNRQRKAGQRLSKPLTPSSVALVFPVSAGFAEVVVVVCNGSIQTILRNLEKGGWLIALASSNTITNF